MLSAISFEHTVYCSTNLLDDSCYKLGIAQSNIAELTVSSFSSRQEPSPFLRTDDQLKPAGIKKRRVVSSFRHQVYHVRACSYLTGKKCVDSRDREHHLSWRRSAGCCSDGRFRGGPDSTRDRAVRPFDISRRMVLGNYLGGSRHCRRK
jgi:hypothetical protein